MPARTSQSMSSLRDPSTGRVDVAANDVPLKVPLRRGSHSGSGYADVTRQVARKVVARWPTKHSSRREAAVEDGFLPPALREACEEVATMSVMSAGSGPTELG
jgi:hypothetical protein